MKLLLKKHMREQIQKEKFGIKFKKTNKINRASIRTPESFGNHNRRFNGGGGNVK